MSHRTDPLFPFPTRVRSTAFVGTLLLLSHPFRKSLVRRVGEKGFLGLYSLAALATFGWMIGARLGISSDPVWWVAPPWFWDVATLLMLFASEIGRAHV